MDDGLTLLQIAQRASERNGGVRGRALDRVAKKKGLKLSYTTVDRILAGTYTSTPSKKTLDALAVLSGYSSEQVYRAAGVPIPMGSFAEQLPPDADLLTGAQREAVFAVVRQFAAVNRALHDREDVMGNAEHPAATSVIPLPPGMSKEDYDQTIREAAIAAREQSAADRRPDPHAGVGEDNQAEGWGEA